MNSFKEKMNEKIKMYSNKQYLDGFIKKEYIAEDGDADIFLKIDDKNSLFDSRTVGDQIDIVEDIYTFIENKTSMLNSDIQIKLHVIGLDLGSKEQGVFKHILKEHYAIELYKVQKQYTKYKNKIFYLMMIGLLSLFGYAFLYFFTEFDFFMEVFGFLFSFALWEGFDSLIYSFSDIKNEREAVTQNLLIDVIFE